MALFSNGTVPGNRYLTQGINIDSYFPHDFDSLSSIAGTIADPVFPRITPLVVHHSRFDFLKLMGFLDYHGISFLILIDLGSIFLFYNAKTDT